MKGVVGSRNQNEAVDFEIPSLRWTSTHLDGLDNAQAVTLLQGSSHFRDLHIHDITQLALRVRQNAARLSFRKPDRPVTMHHLYTRLGLHAMRLA